MTYQYDGGEQMKYALMVGIARYDSLTSLRNPVNDANLLSTALREHGFEVTVAANPDRKIFHESLKIARPHFSTSTIALFYFAGHGLQKDGTNYLIPSDAKIVDESDIDYYSIRLDAVVEAVSSGQNHISILILDACRSNPFPSNRGIAFRGLSYVESQGNMIISFSTSPGNAALDGDGPNSPFTESLFTVLRQTHLTFIQQLCETRQRVAALTSRRQMPWESISLFSDFYLHTGVGVSSHDPYVEMTTSLRNRIQNSKPKFEARTVDLMESTEGGEARFYTNKGTILLVERHQFFEMGQFTEEYYLFNGILFLYTLSTIRYKMPMYMPEFHITDSAFGSSEYTLLDGQIYNHASTGAEPAMEVTVDRISAEIALLIGLFHQGAA